MRYENAKTAAAVKLKGVNVEFEMIDTTLKAVIIRDAADNICRITIENYNVLNCLVPAGPKLEKRHVLHGTTPMGKFREAFGSKYEAEERKREVAGMFREDVELKIECAEIEVDEAGEPKADALADIPF